jgi:hypothetical protein
MKRDMETYIDKMEALGFRFLLGGKSKLAPEGVVTLFPEDNASMIAGQELGQSFTARELADVLLKRGATAP